MQWELLSSRLPWHLPLVGVACRGWNLVKRCLNSCALWQKLLQAGRWDNEHSVLKATVCSPAAALVDPHSILHFCRFSYGRKLMVTGAVTEGGEEHLHAILRCGLDNASRHMLHRSQDLRDAQLLP